MRHDLSNDEIVGLAMALVHDVWLETSRSGAAFFADGERLRALPRVDFAEAERRVLLGNVILERAAGIELAVLPHELALTLQVALSRAKGWSREADWYWLVFDPTGIGFPGMFAPTAYCGGFLLSGVVQGFAGLPLATRGDRDRYLGLVSDFADLVGQLKDRTAGQAERGVFMPGAQLDQAVPLLGGLKGQALTGLKPGAERIAGEDADAFLAEVERRLEQAVAPAFDAFAALLSGDYAKGCGDAVGLSQYPGGREVYDALVRMHTTMDLTVDQVHATGLERMARIEGQMAELLDAEGFSGDAKAYVRATAADPAWRAETPEAIGAVFQRYIDRLKPKLDEAFHSESDAPYRVEPLPDALTGSMTFGYYAPPSAEQPAGRYLFNARNLAGADLCGIASLNYHELAPGHHLQISRQQQAKHLHPLRKNAMFTAYAEGWAEYAATLAGELGGYEAPQERFGRMMMDAFLTCRLVIDTGMNALGWSLDQARDYMREHTFMSEAEIGSEPVRYACDIPGQALAYKLGDTRLIEMREEMRAALGQRFDIRDFHEAVLRPGSLPLGMLAGHLRRETARIAAAAA